ncbi:hypothetical protein PtrSN002B_007594 [Pyrenophora tritici-repentis]|uniref:Uncharacterized protein n=2 Tax=Pyrenophora tritici-repentis TaxID=45151 RepID=A0A2W1GMT5_9PLEO|nr:uncharacterized protein PTRG_01197 [Pyrenophora tritici-repentis Pt-1C-BFP]KAA8625833.1 hypothetical protein PtrV1_01513 [Pyrenophora tritici-repentis]EDU40635.1 conserved hypothetical protein [Pyrenophora tritici-repentis Pt-1C-BFP]KAF7454251.1 hypothetical protein A1F99_015090 [Pyrenophora tritici-repentis]KAF7577349.1 hypothetical protein PtrM4_015890 [Pyrenophora tritici-repentis]KAG9387997.1 hypothetical protein A1F94_000889 [Pyrenophora tritici-repentis]
MFQSSRRPKATLRPVSSSRNGVKKPPKWTPRTAKPIAEPATSSSLRLQFTPLHTRVLTPYPFNLYHDEDDEEPEVDCELLYDDDLLYDEEPEVPGQILYDDESQDDEEPEDNIIVNSVELGPSMRSIGVAHYLEQIAKFSPDDFTPLSPSDYSLSDFSLRESSSPSCTPWSDEDEDEATGSGINPPQGRWGPQGINYNNFDMPMPPSSVAKYEREIYKTSTFNPAICLAIIRIAEKNMPAINFSSAVNHLPNLRPRDPLPKLNGGIVNAQYKERRGDIEMNVIFLPHFYYDGRHALGYYALSPEPDNWAWAPHQADLFVKHELFTPCTSWDLEQYDLVDYVEGLDTTFSTDGEGLDAEYIESVGVRGGMWLAWNVVEDYEYWVAEWRIVKGVWERDLAMTRGVEETSMSELETWRVSKY